MPVAALDGRLPAETLLAQSATMRSVLG
jgi:hypothetical protein